MKRPCFTSAPHPSSRRAFTLVEMLVVITIIGILAGLVTAAAVVAQRRAKIAVVVMEVKQLETACQAYKEKFGEYPPDFFGINLPGAATNETIRTAAQSAVLRHLSRAFPRFVIPGANTAAKWAYLRRTVQYYWGVDIGAADGTGTTASPFSAMAFWLGGKPDWLDASNGPLFGSDPNTPFAPVIGNTDRPIRGFLGFSANPANPFDNSTSRIKPLFEFDPMRIALTNTAETDSGFRYWAEGTMGDKTTGAICYFRAESSGYYISGQWKLANDPGATTTQVRPAIDRRLSTAFVPPKTPTWMNPSSFQIYSSGLDSLYASSVPYTDFFDSAAPINGVGPYLFPSGDNYDKNTYDDITNFANGRLEDSIP